MQQESTLLNLFRQFRQAYQLSPYPDYAARVRHLKKLKALVLEHQQALISAMSDDFGHRSADDSKIGDILTTVQGINYTLNHLKQWMQPEKRHVGILFQPASARVVYQPKGVIGIMVPWNYPIFLALGPLTAALAAGNRAMIKMSEFTPKTSALLAELISRYFEPNQVAIVEGDAQVAADFSSLAFDHLFFTGSTSVGKLVMKAAAENLVPVTLELGGKSPVIIDDEIDIAVAVDRMIMGKTLNCGQTCVAPDYVLLPKGKADRFTDALKTRFNSMFPSLDNNNDYTCIVNDGQFKRLQHLVEDAEAKGADIIPMASEKVDSNTRQFPLTVLRNVTDDMLVMQQEIFGPLIPVLEYDNLAQAIAYVNNHERPLALYIASFNAATQQTILENTHSGGVCINDASVHVGVDDLPFGGIGASGLGNYHGIEGFKTFSHAKAIFKRGRFSAADQLFPPYGKMIHQLVYKLFIR